MTGHGTQTAATLGQQARETFYSRFLLMLLGMGLVYAGLAHFPRLAAAVPGAVQPYVRLLEWPLEGLGVLLFLTGLLSGSLEARRRRAGKCLLLFVMTGTAFAGYHHLKTSGRLGQWLQRAPDTRQVTATLRSLPEQVTQTLGRLRMVTLDNVAEVFDKDVRGVQFNGGYAVGARGNPIKLRNQPEAADPSFATLIAFLQRDDTDEIPYDPRSFVCGDYAERLHNRAEAAGIRCAYVVVKLGPSPGWPRTDWHALNAFDTIDHGRIYIDCTRPLNQQDGPADCWVKSLRKGALYDPQHLTSQPSRKRTPLGQILQIEPVRW